MTRTQALKCLGTLISATTFFATPVAALAGEQTLEFKLVTKAIDANAVQAPNIEGADVDRGRLFWCRLLQRRPGRGQGFHRGCRSLEGHRLIQGLQHLHFRGRRYPCLELCRGVERDRTTRRLYGCLGFEALTATRPAQASSTASQRNGRTMRRSSTLRSTLRHHNFSVL